VRDHFGFKTEFVIDDQAPDERLSKCERLLSRVGRLTPGATVYLAGTGFPTYFDPRA
jgi:hypothetical protein